MHPASDPPPATGWALRIYLVVVVAAALFWRLAWVTEWPNAYHGALQYESAITTRTLWLHLRPEAGLTDAEKTWVADGHWRVTSPPILQGLVAGVYWAAGAEVPWAVFVLNTGFWLLAAWFVHRTSLNLTGRPFVAAVNVTWFLLAPFGVILCRSFQPEALVVAAFAAGLWLLTRPADAPLTARRTLVLAAGCAALGFVKPGVLLPPLFAVFAVRAWTAGGPRATRLGRVILFGVVLAAPSTAYATLAMSGQAGERFRPELLLTAAYYTDLARQVGKSVGFTATALGLGGAILLAARGKWALVAGFVGYAGYCAVFTWHTMTHDYYHAPLAVLVALGVGVPVHAALAAIRPLRDPLDAAGPGVVCGLVAAAAAVLFGSRDAAFGPWRYIPAARAALDQWGAALDSARGAYEDVGRQVPPGSRVLGLSEAYGLPLEYHAWVRTSWWPAQIDLAYMTRGPAAPFDPAAHLDHLIRTTDPDYFVVTDLGELRRQPYLPQLLAPHFTPGVVTDRYQIYTRRR